MFNSIENIKQPEVLKNIDELLDEFKQGEQPKGEKLKFEGVRDKDVYNTTAPFNYNGRQYLIGRVESPDKDTDSQSMFFIEEGGVWRPDKNIPPLDLQDPFFTKINREFIVGGVETYPNPTPEYPDGMGYLTAFFRGVELDKLKKFSQGPEFMKDIRIIKLPNGKIGVFTRPGDIFTRSKDGIGGLAGYIEIDSLEDLTIENINQAEIIGDLFAGNEWGGANELYLLGNGNIGVLGHIARFNQKEEKEYYAMTFEFNPQTKKINNKKIAATRDDFPKGKKKLMEYKKKKSEDYLTNIIYPGGMAVKEDGAVELYAGLSDAEAGKATIEYPFSSPIKQPLSFK